MSRGRKPVVQCTQAEWKEITRRMAASCSPPDGFVWRFVWAARCSLNDDGAAGTITRKEPTGGRPGVLTIRIEKGESYQSTAATLIHEVAHAFDMWTHHSWAGDHSATFGVWWARVHCRYHGVS